MQSRIRGVTAAAAVALALGAGAARADVVLWYNGNFDGGNGLANEHNSVVSDARIYDDFVVTDPAGWMIDRIWSNNLMTFTGTQAEWSIRTGVSSGNGGTVVASGTSAATQTPTGRSGFGMTEYTIEVDGLSVTLAPGTYWLAVTPIGAGSGRSFDSTTSGSGSIGTPGGNNYDSFFDSTFFGANFQPTGNEIGGRPDFSMGVAGDLAVPEPGTFLLAGLSLVALAVARRRQG